MKIRSRITVARLLGAGIVAAAFMLHSTSFADNGPGSSAADALLNTGVERYTRHDYEGARDAFARAYELDPTQVGTLFNLALAEIQSGRPLEAVRHLRTYLASPLARPEKVESIRSKWLPQAEARIGRVSIDAPAGSAASVDGVGVGDAPFAAPLDVAVGEHDVRARLGSREELLHVSTPAGVIVAVRFLSTAAEPPPPPASASSASGARPIATDEPALAAPSGNSPAKVITVSVLGAGALAATGVAIAFGIGAVNAKNRADSLRSGLSSSACVPGPSIPPACPQLAAANSDQNHNFNLQLDFYATAGALAAVGIATWFLWPRSRSQSAWSIQPAFDGRSASALVVGAF
jgi:tetratricopeptide (TPR) repeat protein